MARVTIASGLIERLEEHARLWLPKEGCGLLLGQVRGAVIDVVEVAFSGNVTAGDPTKTFEIDPTLIIRLQKEARAGGLQIVGVWHSHPSGVAQPSDTDKARSTVPGWIWIITGLQADTCTTNAFLVSENDPELFLPLVDI